MGTKDISRSMFDPRKHYTGKWTLQGRLITDFDENDRESIAAEERRRANLDIIGAYGSPDDGFRIDNARSVGGVLDFDILAGSLYLGGLRLEQETLQTYRTQQDDLQAVSHPAGAGGKNRRDLVMLEAYDAPVTAVEDGELLDPAVGVDTSARGRRFQRIRVFTDVGAQDCDQAWQLIATIMDATNTGEIGPDLRQIVNTRLTVAYTEDGIDDDLCEPPLTGGYLGAENQALRVQLVDDGHLTWGYDNAAPLYRVSLSADRSRVSLITPPRDLYSTPIVGQVIEIQPWGAVLSNGEKTAALSGHLTRITAVDPSDEAAGGAITVTLADPLPVAGFDDWKSRPDAAQLGADGVFYYMHIWNRGSDVTSSPAIPFTVGTPLTLGTTGIQITLSGDDAVRDDYWVIGARPETPTQAFPWALESGAAPTGLHRYYAPLGIIRWHADGSISVSDCRPPFRPLTAIDGCCSFSVGDGKTSDGDFNDLNTALDRLGANGGEICLLAGVHRANVNLVGRNNISISGCGERSKLIPAKPDGGPVVTISDCAGIGLFNFEIISVDGTGVQAELVDGLRMEDMKFLAYKVGIDVDDSLDVAIRRCVVRMLDKEGGDVGIYAQGERVCIEDCDIQVIPGGDLPEVPDDGDEETPPVDPTDPCADPEDFYSNLLYLAYYVNVMWGIFTFHATPKNPYQTLGGVQIGSGSEEVIVRRNTIIGGAGNGITLGSDIADIDVGDQESPPSPDGNEEEVHFSHDFDIVRGKVLLDNDTIGSMTITFVDSSGEIFTFPVDAGGNFRGELPPGEYVVSVSDPGVVVTGIEALGEGAYYVIVRKQETRPSPSSGGADLLAFIHQVTLEDNRIANMGFSGIGAPRFISADAAALREFGLSRRGLVNSQLLLLVYAATGTITGFVIDLTIYRNTITKCLQNAVLTKTDEFSIERALGGISLALCNGVSIEENMIRDCGRGAEMPVCGIFISFSVDVTIRENQILNNGQDRRAEQVIVDFVEAPSAYVETSISQPDVALSRKMSSRQANYSANSFTYDRYRMGLAAGNLATNVPDIEFGRGPRAAILLPICLSANLFAGGAAQKATANLNTQGLTGAAKGRHAARIDGNYVIQPFGKSLFVGAAGTLSITNNQLSSDRALPRELDALAGGLSGRFASSLVIGPVDFFAANVMVVDICPGAYIVDTIKVLAGEWAEQGDDVPISELEATPIPFGFPDGNVLFAGNQIKQGDAGARPTLVTVASMDDVNFVNNQIDVLNGTDVRTTAVVFGVTSRAANNRMKEPMLLALHPSAAGAINERGGQRFSLVEIGLLMGGMINNQGNYCFKLITNNGEQSANTSLAASLIGRGLCDKQLLEPLPDQFNQAVLMLLTVSASFAMGLSKLDE